MSSSEIVTELPPSTNQRPEIRRIIAIYFLTFASRGLVIPFLNIYLKSVGFSGTEIGFLVGVSAVPQLLLTPLFNTLADRTGRHRQLLYSFLIGNIGSLLGLVISANKYWLGATILLREMTDRPSAPLLTQLTITWLNKQKRAIYGRLRGWGSLGWAVVTFMSGRIYDVGGYHLLFILAAVLNLIALWFARVLPARTVEKPEQSQGKFPRTKGFYILLGSLFLYFVAMSASYTFMYIYFQDTLGANNEMIGILVAVAALAEIPSMMFIDALLKRINLVITLAIGILGMSGLWLSFALLTGTTLLLPLMIVRGTFYTFQSVAISLLVSQISHPANVATNQSLALVTVPGLAVLLTGPISGWIFDNLGSRVLFEVVAIIGMLSAVILVMGKHYMNINPHVDAPAEPAQVQLESQR